MNAGWWDVVLTRVILCARYDLLVQNAILGKKEQHYELKLFHYNINDIRITTALNNVESPNKELKGFLVFLVFLFCFYQQIKIIQSDNDRRRHLLIDR